MLKRVWLRKKLLEPDPDNAGVGNTEKSVIYIPISLPFIRICDFNG